MARESWLSLSPIYQFFYSFFLDLENLHETSYKHVFLLYSIGYATALLLLYWESSGIKYALLIA